MQHLKQSTASQEISLGYYLDSTDGNTEETGLTIANTDIKLRKGGTTTLANKNSGGATHISNGIYHATLDATDTNTIGQLEIYTHVTGALATKNTYMVLTATAYDALYAGTFNNLGGTAQTADHTSAIADIPTVAEFNARTLVAASYFDPTADAVANVTLVATTTTNTDMRGTDSANTVVPPSVSQFNARTILSADYFDPAVDAVANVTLVATTTTNTDMVGTDNAATSAKQDTMETTLDAIPTTPMRGTDGANTVVPDAAGTAPTVTEILTTQMTESYAADGVAPTLAQAIFNVQQNLGEFAYVGTTKTTKKIDGTTTAATYTLDDATNPTSSTRSS